MYVEAGRGRFLSKTNKPLRRLDVLANTIAKELAVPHVVLDGERRGRAGGSGDALPHSRDDRDPLELLPEAPARVAEAVRALDPAALRKPEAEGKWSVLHVVQHLADSEIVNSVRSG